MPLVQVTISATRIEPMVSGSQPPDAIFSPLANRKTQSRQAIGAIISQAIGRDQFHM